MSDKGWESYLDDDAANAAPEPEPQAPEPVAEAEPGDTQEAAPPAAETSPEREPDLVPRKAILDERRKRQELERKLKDYEERLNQQPKPQAQQQAPPPDWYTDPEAAARSFEQQLELRMYQTAVYQSETMMRQQHQDYDEVAALFAEEAEKDPSLAMQVYRHPMPAQFAYQHGRRLKLMREIGDDPDAYRAKLAEEIRAELAGTTPQAKAPAKAAPVPRSLARDVSQQPRANGGKFASYDTPAPIEDLLGD